MEKLRSALHAFELGEVAEQILQFSKNSIRATTTPTADDAIQIGHSKIGGAPDVPTDFVWPYTNNNQPLYFLCQLNLMEVKPYDSDNLLPDEGVMLLNSLGAMIQIMAMAFTFSISHKRLTVYNECSNPQH